MKYQIYLTDQVNNHRLDLVNDELFVNEEATCQLKINKKKSYQKIIGFGGAFTESACYNLTRIAPSLQEEALKAYFGPEGIGYSLGRMTMGGCDFSLSSYQYIDDFDTSLNSFSINRDKLMIIPVVKKAMQIKGEKIKMLISPWSPPAFMKDNHQMIRGGHLLRRYYQTWANYFVKYLECLKIEGIEVFGLTSQNEVQAIQRWDSCIYGPEEERDFIRTALGPTLYANNYQNINIYILDHNRDIMLSNTKSIYEDFAGKYVTGTAIHWYDNEPYDNLTEHHHLYPEKEILSTESCIEKIPSKHTYADGERYGRNILENMRHYCCGFLDWNLFLDETGGPNWVNNLCDAPIIIHVNQEKIIYQTSYYYIGHFSKFIAPGSIRIETTIKEKGLRNIGFITPNNDLILIIMNDTEQDEICTIELSNEKKNILVPRHAIITIKEEAKNE